MKMFLDCLPCVLNQILDASRMSTQDEKIHAEIMAAGFVILAQYEKYHSSPDIVADLHKVVKKKTGVEDPYSATKTRDIEAALKAYPFLIRYLNSGLIEGRKSADAFLSDPLQSKMYRALKIAVTGNIMDSAIIKEVDLNRSLSAELKKAFVRCDLDLFMQKISSAQTVLFIGDNAGEAVFDRVMIDYLNHPNLYYAVRDIPIINDVTMEDALAAGLGDGIHLISSGSDAPAAIISRCSGEFLDIFDRADVVISKGQGNFEALSDCGREVYFLLKAKCAMIARRLDISMNEYVFYSGGDDKPGA